jgi:hypothetical protein
MEDIVAMRDSVCIVNAGWKVSGLPLALFNLRKLQNAWLQLLRILLLQTLVVTHDELV